MRPTHRAANRRVQPIGSPYWRTHYRCLALTAEGHCESLTAGEARARVSTRNILGGEADEEFPSPGMTDVYIADLSRFERERRRKVEGVLSSYDLSAAED
jgi:hypothetical protein